LNFAYFFFKSFFNIHFYIHCGYSLNHNVQNINMSKKPGCPINFDKKFTRQRFYLIDGSRQMTWNQDDEGLSLINKKFLPGGPGGAVFTKRVPPGGRRRLL